MSKISSQTIQELKKALPFLKNLIIVQEADKIEYMSENWSTEEELQNLISTWKKEKIKPFTFQSKKYMMRICTSERMIASCQNVDHLIGVKHNTRIVIAEIEADGIIPFTTSELVRFINTLNLDKKYKIVKNARTKKTSSNEVADVEEKEDSRVTFTARLMAYYRDQEKYKKNPLIIDPLAKHLAGDLSSYLKDHIRHSEMDYPIVRSQYIEKNLLKTWCEQQEKSQIVIMGAGLDTRAYRFKPITLNEHIIFEIDLPEIIAYKQLLLEDETPLCNLKRIPADLSKPDWIKMLKREGFSKDVPTFWILEGLVYYIKLKEVIKLLKTINANSNEESKLFVDIMQRSRWFDYEKSLHSQTTDSFSKHFEWGMDIKNVPNFFSELGWNVECNFADDFAQDRDVGQNAMIFIVGKKQMPEY